jgi:hypothetical protein
VQADRLPDDERVDDVAVELLDDRDRAQDELRGERPIANAFGTRVSASAIRGLGRSACTHRRSTIACSAGASRGDTSRAPTARKASLSDRNSCPSAR